ncbi:hypothetical protein LOK49_LG07G02704 [Camellia lanceoleosa]|uniref:Uncharacterized protein n=1 Tax=Camellia lanceoleosa TaxID=1840588 RepID=A0ACC0H3R7_9ERIC|nr:hypothetical protein LOK49_LG07G02704 [Camellia lanceoleosa]
MVPLQTLADASDDAATPLASCHPLRPSAPPLQHLSRQLPSPAPSRRYPSLTILSLLLLPFLFASETLDPKWGRLKGRSQWWLEEERARGRG